MKTDEYGNPTILFDAQTDDTDTPIEAKAFSDGTVQIMTGFSFGSLNREQALEFSRWIADAVGDNGNR